jgi:hypothetical protein
VPEAARQLVGVVERCIEPLRLPLPGVGDGSGLPTIVMTLPMLALVAVAMRKSVPPSCRRRTTPTSTGVRRIQTASLTRIAEKKPTEKTTSVRSPSAERVKRRATAAPQSKNPARSRWAARIIMPSSRTSVSPSMLE